jgi:hypothetical protein
MEYTLLPASFWEQALPFLQLKVEESGGASISPNIINLLRKNFPYLEIHHTALLADIAMGTYKARKSKDKDLQNWLFTKQSYEQSSAPVLAAYHMQVLGLKPGNSVLEICTGAGMHALQAAKAGATVLTIEADPFLAALAERNFKSAGLQIQVICAPAQNILSAQMPEADVFWADPSRRTGDGKHALKGEYSPPLSLLIEKGMQFRRAGIKIAPAENIDPLPKGWVRQFISFRGECREQILWFGTDIADGSIWQADTNLFWQPESKALPTIASTQELYAAKYIVEPDPALIRGDLGSFYASHDILIIDPMIAYGVCCQIPHPLEQTLLTVFEIQEIIPWQRSALRAKIIELGWGPDTEIKKRGFPLLPEQIRKHLSFKKNGRKGVLICTRRGDEHLIFFCRRLFELS